MSDSPDPGARSETSRRWLLRGGAVAAGAAVVAAAAPATALAADGDTVTLGEPNDATESTTITLGGTGAAERAMQTLNGRRVHQQEIRVNWAYQSNTVTKEDTSNHFHIFVGDLSNEVNDEVLLQAFSAFGTVSEARVMWDMKTGRSRGYGFVAFRDRGDAEKALSNMDGEWLG